MKTLLDMEEVPVVDNRRKAAAGEVLGALEIEVSTRVQRGDLWMLGRHFLYCGDSTDTDCIGALWQGERADIILTDPPYCSGGFQERDRAGGSIVGLRGDVIRCDNLTTGGLEVLIEKAIGRLPCSGCALIFTDWRQVFTVRRAVEPLGYQYRALLVWDKETLGPGGPFRNQHEMIYFGSRRKELTYSSANVGNVIREKRSGNKFHSTEKPVGLLRKLLSALIGERVGDPFLGSGSTLLAAEWEGRTCYGMEVDPRYCDVVLRRFETLTGVSAVKLAHQRIAPEIGMFSEPLTVDAMKSEADDV